MNSADDAKFPLFGRLNVPGRLIVGAALRGRPDVETAAKTWLQGHYWAKGKKS